jgi:hypothetical protein
MKYYRRRKNFLRALILGFATAAIVVSSAEARVSNYNTSAQNARAALNQTYTPEALKALELRSEAMNKLYQSQALRPDDRSGIHGVKPVPVQAATDLTQVQRQVEADRIAGLIAAESKRPDDKAGFHGPGVVETRTAELVTVKDGGFDWTDASIGAGTMVGIVLLLMGGIALSRRRSELAV